MPDELILHISAKDDGSIVIKNFNREVGETDKKVKGLVPGLESARQKMTGFVGENAALIGVLVGVGVALKKAVDNTMRYAGEVRDLTLATGGNAEASSRLLQVLDDYQITAGDVTAGMRAMKEKGIVPTVDALATLSDQFLSIQDPAEKLKFAQDNLGRSSAKFLNVLSQGGDKIRELNDGISENLILTDADIAKTEEARLAFDAWGDAVQGLQVSFATGLLPTITKVMNGLTRTSEIRDEANRLLQEGVAGNREEALVMAAANVERMHSISLLAEDKGARDENTLSIEEQTAALQEQSEANTNLLSLIGTLQSETDSYREAAAGLHEQQEVLRQDYVDGKVSGEEYAAQMDEIVGAVKANEAAHEQAGRVIMFNLRQQFAMMDGVLTPAELGDLEALGVGWEIFSQTTVNAAHEMMGSITGLASVTDDQLDAMDASFKDPVSKMTQMNEKLHALQNMAGQMWTYYVNIETSGSFPNFPGPNNNQSGPGVSAGVGYQSGFATGGSFVIPPQYGYEGFGMGGMATASAGELVTITPNGGKKPSWGTTININGPIYVYANNATEFMDSIQGEL